MFKQIFTRRRHTKPTRRHEPEPMPRIRWYG
jgi:hypothetical protein